MKPISLVFNNDTLMPDTPADLAEMKDRFGDGELVVFDPKAKVSDTKGNAAFWSMINKALKLIDNADDWDGPEDFADAVKIAVGLKSLCQTINGKPYFRSKSLSTVKDWEKFNLTVRNTLESVFSISPRDLMPVEEGSTGPVSPDKPVDPDLPALTKECMDKFLDLGMSMDWPGAAKAHKKVVDERAADWKKALPPIAAAFVDECAKAAYDLIDANVFPDRAKKRLADLAKMIK